LRAMLTASHKQILPVVAATRAMLAPIVRASRHSMLRSPVEAAPEAMLAPPCRMCCLQGAIVATATMVAAPRAVLTATRPLQAA
jgi:hypothetical protein